tara:strand:+ start:2613 stop:3233 length:621 start_codon:yes stop_codon:yes gene_type:complete
MSLNRLRYDTNSYKHSLAESVGPLEYQLGTPQQCDECFVKDPNYRLQRNGVSTDKNNVMIDVDSELLNLTRKLSNDPTKKYIPKEDESGNLCTETKKFHPKECNIVKSEYTLLSNPPCNLRGTGWNRWEWLCQDPQENIITPFYFGTDTKQLSKDLHRPCVPMPFKNQGLPVPSSNEVNDELEQVEGVPTGPLSTSWQNINRIKYY